VYFSKFQTVKPVCPPSVFYPCVFNALSNICAIMNCSVLAMSIMFCSGLIAWNADNFFITVTYFTTTSKRSACRILMQTVSTNITEALVCKREYYVILWRQKQLISSNNDHHTPHSILEFRRGAYNQAVPGHHQTSARPWLEQHISNAGKITAAKKQLSWPT